ncbi:Magnesium transporter MRS2-I [Acorus calamus]|uniref:Magnesium transporter n=1 Tax=Acorus calamus TaxID=4465 RepID=A0AAV9EK75_ACOCL|nr:Magnesium transporter MRS2-I [Acorus calamus]
MAREGLALVPAASSAKAASSLGVAGTSRSWILMDSTGEGTIMDVDKYAIMHRVQIHARDLRIIDPLLSYPSTILGRERAIVLNLEVLLRDPLDDNVIPIVEELRRRLPPVNEIPHGKDEGGEQLSMQHDVEVGEEDAAIVQNLQGWHTTVRDELEQLLDDDDDMADLYLSRKLAGASSPVSGSGAPNWFPASPTIGSKISRVSRASALTNHGNENDVEELEMLLEAYFMQIDGTLNRLTTLREYIDDTEDYINIQLDNHRNQLIQLELFLSSGTVCLSFYALIAGIFGMNIPFSWNDHHGYVYKWVVSGAGLASSVIFILIVAFARHKGLIGS